MAHRRGGWAIGEFYQVWADAVLQKITATNGESGLNPLEKLFIVDAVLESVALLDRSGPKYRLNIGP